MNTGIASLVCLSSQTPGSESGPSRSVNSQQPRRDTQLPIQFLTAKVYQTHRSFRFFINGSMSTVSSRTKSSIPYSGPSCSPAIVYRLQGPKQLQLVRRPQWCDSALSPCFHKYPQGGSTDVKGDVMLRRANPISCRLLVEC